MLLLCNTNIQTKGGSNVQHNSQVADSSSLQLSDADWGSENQGRAVFLSCTLSRVECKRAPCPSQHPSWLEVLVGKGREECFLLRF